jgi:hypothetical protein
MLALSPAMRAFVVGKVLYGQTNTDAARGAGYSARSPHALGVVGSRLAHDQRIQAAILEEGQKLMRTEGPKSVLTLVEIRDDKRAAAKDRLKAATELLDRSGFHAINEQHISVEHSLTDKQKDDRILALAAEIGISQEDANKLLIAPPRANEPIDAEFEVVAPLDPVAAERRERANELRRRRRSMTPAERAAHREQMRQERIERGKERYAAENGETDDIEW